MEKSKRKSGSKFCLFSLSKPRKNGKKMLLGVTTTWNHGKIVVRV